MLKLNHTIECKKRDVDHAVCNRGLRGGEVILLQDELSMSRYDHNGGGKYMQRYRFKNGRGIVILIGRNMEIGKAVSGIGNCDFFFLFFRSGERLHLL